MKYTTLIILILVIFIRQTIGQVKSETVYKNLKTKKFYSVNTECTTTNGSTTYKVNDKKVRKSTYKKYRSTWKNMENCCPCILKSYDENNNLLRESVSYTDCEVGWFKDYYLNGKIKLIGSYKENPTANWEDLDERGYCNVPHGEWKYFEETGNMLYSEFWENGNFIKQVPEQSTAQIWDVELTLNGQEIKEQSVGINQISELKINPKYKNSNIDSNLIIKFEVSAIGYKINNKQFTIKSFKNIDVEFMLSEVGIPKDKKTSFILIVLNGNEVIKRFFLNVKK